MFTGIVEETGTVISASAEKLVISAGKALQGMAPGDSVTINGACLTATRVDTGSFSVDIMPETLRRTNLGLLATGSRVNLETALTPAKLLGGHLVQGHIDATGRVASIIPEYDSSVIRIEAPPEVMRYVVANGFIAVDGISLTVVTRSSGSFEVSIVRYTLENTNLGTKRAGDLVNLEVDIIAKYVEQFTRGQDAGITFNFLKEHGFIAG